MHRILAVDDDPAILRSLRRGLLLEGFAVDTAASGAEALEAIAGTPPDAVVLDVSMPGVSGIEVCSELRGRRLDLPILMLSALDEVDDRVAGLAAGADDYMVKPFALAELVLRLRALLRRALPTTGPAAMAGADPVRETGAGAGPAGIRVGPLTIDPGSRRVALDGTEVTLTRREFDLLEVLARNAGLVLSRSVLLERVWGYDFEVTDNAVDTFVGYLRRKLEAGGGQRMLHTVRGVGFVLRPPGPTGSPDPAGPPVDGTTPR